MRTWLILIILQLYSAGIAAQTNSNDEGLIYEFDCRIDSFKLTHSKSLLNELRKFIYDSEGKIKLVERFSQHSESSTTPFERCNFSYDDNNNQTLILTESYDPKNGTWTHSQKEEIEYDSQHRITLHATYKWNTASNVWEGIGLKTINKYLFEGIEDQITYEYNLASSQWEECSKTRVEQESNLLTSYIFYENVSNQFIEKSKYTIERTFDGLSETETCYKKDGAWIPIFRRTTTHSSQTNQTTETTESYMIANWQPVYQLIISFNNSQEVSKIQESYFDFNLTQWQIVKEETYEKHYSDGIPNLSIESTIGEITSYSHTSSIHKEDGFEMKSEQSYSDGAPTDLLSTSSTTYRDGSLMSYSIQNHNLNAPIDSKWIWEMNTNGGYIDFDYSSLNNRHSFRYYISDIGRVPTPVIPDDKRYSLKMYPNPVEDQLTIEHRYPINQPVYYILFDINGKIAHRGQLESKFTLVNLSHLSAGIYLMNVHFGASKIKPRVIIKK